MHSISQHECNENAQNKKSVKAFQATMQQPSRTVVHAKLEMTNPDSQEELEADAVANDIVQGGKIARSIFAGGAGGGISVSSQMEGRLNSMQGGGQVMSDGLRNMMERGFNRDFSQVRLHTDSEAASLSSSINAKAFTHGNDIYFNQGQFSPNTSEGQKLMAHELTHVVQGGGKIGREDMDSDTCGDVKIPDFDSCKAFDPLNCIEKKYYHEFEDVFESKCGRYIDQEIDNKINDYRALLMSHEQQYHNAVDTFYSKLKDFDESLITFSFNSLADIFGTFFGVLEVFVGKKGQAAIEIWRGAMGNSTIKEYLNDTFLGEFYNKKKTEDRILKKSEVREEYSIKAQKKIYGLKILGKIVSIDESKHHDNTTQNHNTVAYIKKQFSKEDLINYIIEERNKILQEEKGGESGWLACLAQAFVTTHLKMLEKNNEENEDSYYNIETKLMEGNDTFSCVGEDHKLINKVLETFFLGGTYPHAITSNEYKMTVDALKRYNDDMRKKFRKDAESDACAKGNIYFDEKEFHYVEDGINSYYIDWLNNVMDMEKYDSIEKLPKEDREFNSKIYPSLYNKALKYDNIYFNGQKYDQPNDFYNDFLVDALNAITIPNKENDGYKFNKEIYDSLKKKLEKKYVNEYIVKNGRYVWKKESNIRCPAWLKILNLIIKVNNINITQ